VFLDPLTLSLSFLDVARDDLSLPKGRRVSGFHITPRPRGRSNSTVHSLQWLLRRVHDPGATSLVIAAPAANINTAVSRRTTRERLPQGRKPQHKRLPDRPRRPRRLPRQHESTKRTSLGRRPPLVALSRARERHARSVAAECGHPFRVRSQSVPARSCHSDRFVRDSLPTDVVRPGPAKGQPPKGKARFCGYTLTRSVEKKRPPLAGYRRPRLSVSPWRILRINSATKTSVTAGHIHRPHRAGRFNRGEIRTLTIGVFSSGSLEGSDRSSLTCIHYIPRPSEKTDYRETLDLR
jgi:hypothetical protein